MKRKQSDENTDLQPKKKLTLANIFDESKLTAERKHEEDNKLVLPVFNMVESIGLMKGGQMNMKQIADLNFTKKTTKFVAFCLMHPTRPEVVVGGNDGLITIWIFEQNLWNLRRSFNLENKFHPVGGVFGKDDMVYCWDKIGKFYMKFSIDMNFQQLYKTFMKKDETTRFVQLIYNSHKSVLIAATNKRTICRLNPDPTGANYLTHSDIQCMTWSHKGVLLLIGLAQGLVQCHYTRGIENEFQFETPFLWYDYCNHGEVTAISVSKNDKYIATGGSNGYINVYKSKDIISCNGKLINENRPNPIHSINNITPNPIKTLEFSNCYADLLFAASDPRNKNEEVSEKKQTNFAKLFHAGSGRTFSNFPGKFSNTMKYWCAGFSTNDRYLFCGSAGGKVATWRFNKLTETDF